MARQTGLGKGLGALLPSESGSPENREARRGDASSAVPTLAPSLGARLTELDVTAIRPNTFQPRSYFDDEGLESLTESIRQVGVLQPILVRPTGPDSFELIAGERRWRATQRAGKTTIPAIVRPVEDNGALEQALVENLHRQDLNPLEEAAAYRQLIDDFELTHDDVARRVGKSRAAITNTLRLMQLPPTIQRLLLEGRLSAGHARALLGTDDAAYQDSLARRIVAEQLSVRAVEDAVRLRTELTSNPKKRTKVTGDRPAGLIELEELLATHLETRVAVELTPKRGKVVIDFADLDDLERIYRRMVTDRAGAVTATAGADEATMSESVARSAAAPAGSAVSAPPTNPTSPSGYVPSGFGARAS